MFGRDAGFRMVALKLSPLAAFPPRRAETQLV